jgi:predicted regulator of Ras-like GTPase activity (Roadblock/LC7/MglB family)
MMEIAEHISALAKIDGIREATLCSIDGTFVGSSVSTPTLTEAAATLVAAVRNLQTTLPELGSPIDLSIEGESGALHLAQSDDSILVVSTLPDAHQGVVRLEMRNALEEIDETTGA